MIKKLIVNRDCDIILMYMEPIGNSYSSETKFVLVPKKISDITTVGEKFYLVYEETPIGNIVHCLICLDMYIENEKGNPINFI